MEEVIPYMFTTRDYNTKTVNENHQPAMHKRKHDMVLSLNKLNQYSSDETPTPTKFLRNCEAIGLFKDLQNVNPFEETFRQASEAVKKGQSIKVSPIPSLGKSAGEDLHTPHIDLKDDLQSSIDKFNKEEIDKVDPPTSVTFKSGSFSVPSAVCMTKDGKLDNKSENDDVRIYLRMSNGTLLQITSFTNNYEIPKTNVISSGSSDVSTSGFSTSDCISKLQSHSLSNPTSSIAVKKKLKEALMKTPKMTTSNISEPLSAQESKRNHERVNEKQVISLIQDKEADRKKRSLERNRIAAMKCREKRKKWVADLKEKYEKMCFTNQTLIKEVAFLRKEVARLKGLLISSHQKNELPSSTTTINLISPSSSPRRESSIRPDLEPVLSNSPSRGPREGLRLDIEGASKATVMDLDSPLIRKDEILSSVAPPTTPNEKLISFSMLDREAEISEDRATSTTVIQINPNALPKSSLVFS